MDLNPRVEAKIVRARRSAFALRSLVLGLLIAAIVFILVFVIVPYLAGNTSFSPLVRKTAGLGGVLALVILALVADAVFALLYLPGLLRDRAYYSVLTRRAGRFDAARLGTLMNALDGACINAGVPEPKLAILDSSQPNALPFESRGEPVVGVTSGLLDAGLSYAEVEGVMAHELASLITGDFLRRPGARPFETSAYVMLGIFSLVGLAAAPMVSAGRSLWAGVAFLIAVAMVMFLLGFAVRKLAGAKEHDYLHVDSIAAEITGNPCALAEAIRKLDRLVNGKAKGPFPDNELGLKYFFACQYRYSESAAQFVKRRHGDLRWKTSGTLQDRQVDGVQEVMEELACWGEQLIAARLENLAEESAGS